MEIAVPSGIMMPIMQFVGNLGYAAVALSGGMLAIRGVITIGDIQAFIQYVKSFTQPIQQIAQVTNQCSLWQRQQSVCLNFWRKRKKIR